MAIETDGLYLLKQGDREKGTPERMFIEWLTKGQQMHVSAMPLTQIPFSNFKYSWIHTVTHKKRFTGELFYRLEDVFPDLAAMKASLLSSSDKQACIVGVLSIKFNISSTTCPKLTLVLGTEGMQFSLASDASHPSEMLLVNAAHCYGKYDRMQLYCQNAGFDISVGSGSTLSLAAVDKAKNIEGFSALQSNHQAIHLANSTFSRIDGWNSSSSLCFDSTIGFKSPFGSYLVSTTGKYLITANIIFKTTSTR